jgi:hypothetical protein
VKERQGCHWGKEKPVSTGAKGVKRKVVIDVESEDEEEEEVDAPPPRKVARSESCFYFYFRRISLIMFLCRRKF